MKHDTTLENFVMQAYWTPVLFVLLLCSSKNGCGGHLIPIGREVPAGFPPLQHVGGGSSTLAWRFRILMQQTPGNKTRVTTDVPQCMWNDVREACIPSQLAFLSVSSPPVSVFHRTAAMAYDRNLVCSGHSDAARCNKDTKNRCMYWNKSCVGADAYELVNWVGYVDTLDGSAAALPFTCKGTAAAEYKECLTASDAGPNGICNQLLSCHYVKLVVDGCVPKSWDTKPLRQLQDIKAGFDSFNQSVWGSCAGACYVRQAASCQSSRNNSVACQSKPYCVWELDVYDGKKSCTHRDTASRATDPFSKEFARLKDECNQQKTQAACEKLKVVPINIGKYKDAPSLLRMTAETAPNCRL